MAEAAVIARLKRLQDEDDYLDSESPDLYDDDDDDDDDGEPQANGGGNGSTRKKSGARRTRSDFLSKARKRKAAAQQAELQHAVTLLERKFTLYEVRSESTGSTRLPKLGSEGKL